MAAAGLITLMRTFPTIVSALKAGAADFQKSRDGSEAVAVGRTSEDLPSTVVLGGSLMIAVAMWAFLTFMPIPGAPTGAFANLVAAVLVVIFGFLFVTVSSRICGLIGTSSNPISGMTIATLMATCALFLSIGTSGNVYPAAGFVQHVRLLGRARTMELNLEPSEGASLFEHARYGPASETMPAFVDDLLMRGLAAAV